MHPTYLFPGRRTFYNGYNLWEAKKGRPVINLWGMLLNPHQRHNQVARTELVQCDMIKLFGRNDLFDVPALIKRAMILPDNHVADRLYVPVNQKQAMHLTRIADSF